MMQAIITVDTEADGAWDYGATSKVTVENLAHLPRFQALCDRYGMKPTYLCTYEVAKSDAFATLVEWQRDGRAELGAHLHPWTNPPFENGAIDFDASEYPGYPSELALDQFRAKMTALTELIAERSGRRPTSYRAGRWGFAREHVRVLVELGYLVDCSVTPLTDRRPFKGVRQPGPDFRRAPVHPYRLSEDDVCTPGASALVEVPVTVLQPRALLRNSPLARKGYQLLKRVRGAAGLLNRVVRTEPLWFRPYPDMTPQRMRQICRLARELELPVVEMMFHSSELMPGGSESFASAASIEWVHALLEATMRDLRADGIEGVTLTDFARAFAA
jgi:hypothetical protein